MLFMTQEEGVHPPLWDLMMLRLPLPWSMIGYLGLALVANRRPHSMVSQLLPFSLHCSSSEFTP